MKFYLMNMGEIKNTKLGWELELRNDGDVVTLKCQDEDGFTFNVVSIYAYSGTLAVHQSLPPTLGLKLNSKGGIKIEGGG